MSVFSKEINLEGQSAYIEKNEGKIEININSQTKSIFSNEELLSNINQASVDLSLLGNKFQGKIHIDRKETTDILNWIIEELDNESNLALLVGSAGYGKSVVLKDLFDLLSINNIPVLGIKADKILNINSLKDIEEELNLHDNIISIFKTLSVCYPLVVLLIDQIDALSQSLSSNRNAINSYNRLINQLENISNVRIVISCRTYDLEYDSTLRLYSDRKIFNISLLEKEQVKIVLSDIGVTINDNNEKLKEFLRVPLHLDLFCKVGLNKQFNDNITLQSLYDEIWNEYIENKNEVIALMTLVADKMHDQQHIVVDKRSFSQYGNEINYLLHNDLLKETDNKIQFIHQTFFDYVYARTFISSDKSISTWLKSVHQGLFIRSQVKQIFSYLRELDMETYMKELRTVLLGSDYRFHLKLLLLNDLGFYHNPFKQEIKFTKDYIINSSLLFRIFLESIQSPEWFAYIIEQDEFKVLLSSTDEEIEIVIINLCSRIIWQDVRIVVDFISKYPNKIKLIENILPQIPDKDVVLSYELYYKTSIEWNTSFGRKNYYLEKVIITDPDFVIAELKKDFDKNISSKDLERDNYIPRGDNRLHTYGILYKLYPNKAIPYFLYVIEQAVKVKQYKSSYGLYGDRSFHLYTPNPNSNVCHKFENIYDLVLSCIKNNLFDTQIKQLFINSLESRHANLLAIGVYYLLHNVNDEIDNIFNLFLKDNFFTSIDSSEILNYYTKELLAVSYSLFTEIQQFKVNMAILSTKINFDYWTNKDYYTKKKLYSNYLRQTYGLVSILPEEFRNQHIGIKKVYQEGFRKYGKIVNNEPQSIRCFAGDRSYSHIAYERMSFDNWKKTFKKFNRESYSSVDDWGKPSKKGNELKFEEYVSKNPEKFYPFIVQLCNENFIMDYLLVGLNGLKEGNYDKSDLQMLCLNVLKYRKSELKEDQIVTFLRVLRYVILENLYLDKLIIDFIREVIYQYPDMECEIDSEVESEDGMKAVNTGYNSIRGTAVGCLLGCHAAIPFKDEVFEILEFVAGNANPLTRACAIFNGAGLINMDQQRAFDLYLRMVHDYNPLLLAMPVHDGHPLLYHIHYDYEKLVPFFTKVITIKEAAKPMSFFLFNAYLNDKPNALGILKILLNNNIKAGKDLLWEISVYYLNDKRHSEKGWTIINYLLDFEDKEIGEQFDNCFMHIPTELNEKLKNFLVKYLNSPMSQYKGNEFYDFLRKLVVFDACLCLEFFFDSKPNDFKLNFYDESPLNVLIEAYNGIREYEKENPILEKAMDFFDSLLHIPQYRNEQLRTFLKELSS